MSFIDLFVSCFTRTLEPKEQSKEHIRKGDECVVNGQAYTSKLILKKNSYTGRITWTRKYSHVHKSDSV